MPYAIRYYDQDPNFPYKNRGPGEYYQRGLGYFAKIHSRIKKNLRQNIRS